MKASLQYSRKCWCKFRRLRSSTNVSAENSSSEKWLTLRRYICRKDTYRDFQVVIINFSVRNIVRAIPYFKLQIATFYTFIYTSCPCSVQRQISACQIFSKCKSSLTSASQKRVTHKKMSFVGFIQQE
jgi:hypothetical protein